jgi:hypothetical protein
MTPTWLIDSSSSYASGKPEALFNFHIKRDTTNERRAGGDPRSARGPPREATGCQGYLLREVGEEDS